jgi:sulfur-oxidizing protein SoxX
MRIGQALLFALFAALGASGAARADATGGAHPGKALAFNPQKGNCLACHGMPTVKDAEQPGNSGPPLIAMSARFPNKADMRAKIWDATASKPASFMPPFGKHRVLSEAEIDLIVEFVYGL